MVPSHRGQPIEPAFLKKHIDQDRDRRHRR